MTAYVGVSGFMRQDEVRGALAAFPDCGRSLMVGVLVSAKTLGGERNKYPNRYPLVDDIAGIFVDDPRCLNLIHYSSDVAPDGGTLLRLLDLGGPHCHGFQFNGAWPRIWDLDRLLVAAESANRGLRIVLQARRGTDGFLLPPADHYDDAATDILLDASGGRGLPLDVAAAREGLSELLDWDGIGLGVAGGLCAETVGALAPLMAEYPGLSIDAEGRLRTAEDDLDMDKVRAYLRASADVIGAAR